MAKKKAATKPKPRAKAVQPPDIEGLNFRQRMFVSAYLGEANGSATEAARMAGYAQPHSQGPRLLENVGVRIAIDAKLSQSAMSAEETLARISDMASVDMSDFITITKAGKPTIDLRRAQAAGKLHLVKKLAPTKYGLSIELHDSQSALDKLARHHGLFRDRLEITDGTEDAGDPAAVEVALEAGNSAPHSQPTPKHQAGNP